MSKSEQWIIGACRTGKGVPPNDIELTYTNPLPEPPPKSRRSWVCKAGHAVTADTEVLFKDRGGRIARRCGICQENARQRWRVKCGRHSKRGIL